MIKHSAVGFKIQPLHCTSSQNVRFATHLTPLFSLLE
jgi:hypothetical protein